MPETEKPEWLIIKQGLFYRPNSCGYTSEKALAGRYTEAEAKAKAAVEPDRIRAIHESKIPDTPLSVALAEVERHRDGWQAFDRIVTKAITETDRPDRVLCGGKVVLEGEAATFYLEHLRTLRQLAKKMLEPATKELNQ